MSSLPEKTSESWINMIPTFHHVVAIRGPYTDEHTLGKNDNSKKVFVDPLGKNDNSKKVFVDRGALELQKLGQFSDYRLAFYDHRNSHDLTCAIPVEYIKTVTGKWIKGKNGLRKAEVRFDLSEVLDTRTGYVETIVVKMDRDEANRLSDSLYPCWTVSHNHVE
jgi:hypothetical protein